MRYPYVEIVGTAIKGKCRVNLWTCEDAFDTVYKGKKTQEALTDALNGILKDFPDVRVRVQDIVPNDTDYVHIFKVREHDGAISAFARSHKQVPNPFHNRKRYAMVNPQSSVSFHSVEL